MNAVAPGAVDTPLHRNTPKEVLASLSPMGRPSTVKEIADAVMYLTEATTITGDILYVDGGAMPAAGKRKRPGAKRSATPKRRPVTIWANRPLRPAAE